MTAIAAFEYEGFPILFGDLLISGNEEAYRRLHIPGIGPSQKVFPEDSGFVPTNLRQKVCLLNDNLAIAWSGTEIAAAAIIGDIPKNISHVTYKSIKDYFDRLNASELEREIQLLALLIDEETNRSIIVFKNCHHLSHKSYPFGAFGGSGAEAIKQALDENSKLQLEYEGLPNRLIKVITSTSYLLMKLLAHDLSAYRNLHHYFGGGYEVVTNIGGKLRKLDRIAYAYWNTRCFDENDAMTYYDFMFFYYTYSNDCLCIFSLKVKSQQTKNGVKFIFEENANYIVPPVHKHCSAQDMTTLKAKNIEFDYLCNYITVLDDKDDKIIGVTFKLLINDNNNLRFTKSSDNKLSVEVNNHFLDSLSLEALKLYKSIQVR